MKNKVLNIIPNFSALLLIIIMLIPTSIQFIHIFEKHEHNNNCKEITTHLHEKELDCSLCDFHLSSFDITFKRNLEYSSIGISSSYTAYYKSNKYNSTKYSFNLRGPPMF